MIQMISIDRMYPHPDNPRKDLGDITELADSIRERGVLQNLTVVPFDPKHNGGAITIEGAYTIVIGHRRHAAAQLAGLAELPCVISDMTHIEQVGTMMLENLQRSDLTVIEQAAGFQMMMDLGETVDSIAAKTGFGKRTVQHRLNIAKLDREKVSEALHRGGTLLDFIELEKIRDEKKKVRLLAEIGTSNFKWSLSRAIEEQDYPERKKALKAFLEGWAKPVKNVDWNADSQVKYFGGYKLDEDYQKPKDADKGHYVYVDSGQGITLYKRTKVKQKDNSKKEAEFKEREAKLEELSKQAFELRHAFVKDFNAGKKNSRNIMAFAVKAMAYYGCASRERLLNLLNVVAEFEDGLDYDEKSAICDKLISEQFDIAPEVMLLKAAYCKFGDSEQKSYFRAYRYNYTIDHYENSELDRIYEALVALGYEMSDEEKQLQDGTHELLDKKEPEAPSNEQGAEEDGEKE